MRLVFLLLLNVFLVDQLLTEPIPMGPTVQTNQGMCVCSTETRDGEHESNELINLNLSKSWYILVSERVHCDRVSHISTVG